MKLAILIECHKNPKQINAFLETMAHSDITFFIHVDKKSNIKDEIIKSQNVVFLPDELRIGVEWGKYSQVQAILNLLNFAYSYGEYDYFCLLSGQCFPILSVNNILLYLDSNKGKNFVNLFESKNNGLTHTNNYDKRVNVVFPSWLMGKNFPIRVLRRLWVMVTGGYNHTFKLFQRKKPQGLNFYFGSSWWCVTKGFVDWLINFLKERPEFEKFYKLSSCPDESFFQTLLMNSPFSETREDYLHYIDWTGQKNSPNNLSIQDFNSIINSGKLFARKIDNDFELIEKLIENAKN